VSRIRRLVGESHKQVPVWSSEVGAATVGMSGLALESKRKGSFIHGSSSCPIPDISELASILLAANFQFTTQTRNSVTCDIRKIR